MIHEPPVVLSAIVVACTLLGVVLDCWRHGPPRCWRGVPTWRERE